MSGICEPITEGIFVTGDYGAIAIHFKPGKNGHLSRIKSIKTT